MGSDNDLELPIRQFPGRGNAADVLPHFSPDEKPFFAGLAGARLVLQACTNCKRPRFPVAPACPYCLASGFEWSNVRPRGVVHSWARYHRGYLPEFAPLVPYVVLAVRLLDGPVLFGRLADNDVEPQIEMPVHAIAERWADGGHVLAFACDQEAR
ncbi:MAG TPA: OB-fold domain-containing protein [Streptosporangiaceae bacterium]|nr:OB-fold domain-containing protein [Streptosporangiaceae bacterium]